MPLALTDQDGRPLCEVCGRYFPCSWLPPGRYAHLACLCPGSSGPADLLPLSVTDRDLTLAEDRRRLAGLATLPPSSDPGGER